MFEEHNLTKQELLKRVKGSSRMTLERLRLFKGFEGIEEREGLDLIQCMETLCEVMINQKNTKGL
jgi:hypothetical protein